MIDFAYLLEDEKIVMVTSREETTIFEKKIIKDNITATLMHSLVSLDPPTYIISLPKASLSSTLISQSKNFCVNVISPSYKSEAAFCMKYSGMHIDKFEKTRLSKEECDSIDCPRIKEALAYLECEVVEQVEYGKNIIFFGKVTNSLKRMTEQSLKLKK